MAQADKKIVYITGRGRSGSTLLDIVLSQLLDFRSCGELLSGLLRRDTEPCACGKLMKDCDTWKFTPDGKPRDQELFNSMLQRGRFSKVPKALFKWRQYQTSLEQEYDYLCEICETKPGLVDSSKEVSRSIFLSRGPSQALVVHLIRNPAALIASARRRSDKGIAIRFNRRSYRCPKHLEFILDAFTCITWLVSTATLYTAHRNRAAQYCIVDYDLFTKDPVGTAVAIANKLDLPDASRIPVRFNNNEFRVHHLVAGNRMASNSTVSVSPRDDDTDIGFLSTLILWVTAAIPYALIRRSKHIINTQ